MLKHYIKIAVRNLWNKKVFSAINLLGLTVGLTCCLLMALYIRNELSYDRFEPKADRIVRVIMEYSFGGSVNKGNFTSTKVFPSFKKNFAEVEEGVRMTQTDRVVKYGEKLINEPHFMFADSTYFNLFSNQWIRGDPKQALAGLNKVVLTQSTAKRWFKEEDPINKTLYIGSMATPYLVTGIIADCKENGQIKFDFLASFSSLGAIQEETYYDANYTTYLLLKDQKMITGLQARIRPFMKKEMAHELSGSDYINYELEPFRRVHLFSPYDGFEPNNSITYIYIAAAVALLILLIACFTYINLSTARSMERAREVGIRKVAGAQKNQIFRQFIGESLVLSMLACVLSLVLAAALLPLFNQVSGKQLFVADLMSPFTFYFLTGVILFVSLLAGSYPAFVLATFQPVKVLKGSFKNTAQGLWLRKSLLVFQFVISVVLVISTFIIQRQLYYVQHKNLGFDRDHVLVLPVDWKMMQNLPTIKNTLKSYPGILEVSAAVSAPTNIRGGYNMRSATMPEETQLMVTANPVDEDFLKTTGIQLVSGEDLTAQDIKDVDEDKKQEDKTYHYLLNVSAARALGWTPREAIGKKMFLGNHRPGFVKGVVADFHFSSLHNPIKPLVLFTESRGNSLLVKMAGNNLQQNIAHLQSQWKTVVPHRPFEYRFLDEEYNKLYSSELRIGQLLAIFSGIAVLLAALGLFGLSAYATQQRTKEIGVRKVLGASVFQIIRLLSKDFVRLVIVAAVIAFPLAWWLTNKWLEDFAYRIHPGIGVFIGTLVFGLVVALATVSIQAARAASANPTRSLRAD